MNFCDILLLSVIFPILFKRLNILDFCKFFFVKLFDLEFKIVNAFKFVSIFTFLLTMLNLSFDKIDVVFNVLLSSSNLIIYI